MVAKPLSIRFDKIDRTAKIYNGIRYLKLSNSYNKVYHKTYNATFDKINYLIKGKFDITDSINHNFARIRIDSYNCLPVEKVLTFHNIILLIKSVLNENKNNYYYNVFPEIFLNECMFVYYECHISIELTFLEILVLIKQVHQKSVIFATIAIF